jgi:hypothetical protein
MHTGQKAEKVSGRDRLKMMRCDNMYDERTGDRVSYLEAG